MMIAVEKADDNIEEMRLVAANEGCTNNTNLRALHQFGTYFSCIIRKT